MHLCVHFYTTASEDAPRLKNKPLEVHRGLYEAYECPGHFFSTLAPLSRLVSNLLSQRTRNQDCKRAFANLKIHFETLEAVRDAPALEVEKAIQGETWPE